MGVMAERKQQVDESLRGWLRMVVRQADALIGLDEYVLWLVRGLHQQIQPNDGNIQRTCGANGGINQLGMESIRDVIEGAAGMQVRGPSHGQMLAAWQDAVVVETGVFDAAL